MGRLIAGVIALAVFVAGSMYWSQAEQLGSMPEQPLCPGVTCADKAVTQIDNASAVAPESLGTVAPDGTAPEGGCCKDKSGCADKAGCAGKDKSACSDKAKQGGCCKDGGCSKDKEKSKAVDA